MKRLRKPKLKDGQLCMYWGRPDPHVSPDVVLAWQGDIRMKADTDLLHMVICSKRPKITLGRLDWNTMEPSLLEELTARGYDITTLTFSIMKKAQEPKP